MTNTPREVLEILIKEIFPYNGAALERAIYGVIGAAHAFQMMGLIHMDEAIVWGDRARLAGVRKGWEVPPGGTGLDEKHLLQRIEDFEKGARVVLPAEPPSIKPGETRTASFPDVADGIRYTIGRMIQMIRDARKDVLVISLARKIAAVSISDLGAVSPQLYWLRGIHAWCRANFQFVNDPVGIELIQTPNRMLRELLIPQELHTAVWAPIGQALGNKLPEPKMTGDADEATVISLALAAAIGISPLRIAGGGTDGTIHTCWGQAYVDGKWVDVDVLEEWGPKKGPCKAIEYLDVYL